MKRVVLVTAALAAAVAVLALASLPPAHVALSQAPGDGTVPGVLHVHTSRSDGRSPPEVIAAAAARAGLKFVVFTDHGDGTRPPDPPVYRSGVLCLDATEISTTGGHYLALDMPASQYPLAGDARDVVEDVARLGGFGVVAHPDSPRSELRWRDWSAPFDAIEIVNPDTAWRVLAVQSWRSKLRLLDALITYPFRPAETIASLLVDVPETFTHWKLLARDRRIVATAGADAHAVLGWRDVDPRGSYSLPLPSYEASFRSVSIHVRPSRPLSGDAAADSAAIMGAIRRGHLYSAVDGLATPPSFEFTAENRQGVAGAGDELAAGGPVALRVRSNAGENFTTTIWQDDRVLKTARAREATVTAAEGPAVYMVDIRAREPDQPLWLVSNPIYVGRPAPPRTPPIDRQAVETRTLLEDGGSGQWQIEADAMSRGAVDVVAGTGGRELRFQYTLSPAGAPESNAALMVETPSGLAPDDRVTFTARADRPMRISVQFRTGANRQSEERWRKSVYLDATARERTIAFTDLTPVGAARTSAPPLADLQYMLLVVDRTNTKPGSSGTIWIKKVALQK